MASRTMARAIRSVSEIPSFTSTSSRRVSSAPRFSFQHQPRRGFASRSKPGSFNSLSVYGGAATAFLGCTATALLGIYGFTTLANRPTEAKTPQNATDDRIARKTNVDAAISANHSKEAYQAVYNAIAQKLLDEDDYDDGSYAPVVLRLGWHASGTYDAETKTGGSNGATMRFAPESGHSANAGLVHARDFLEPIKKQFPWITYSDLWTLGTVCAVQEMGGPTVPWRPGRSDHDATWCTPDGRLPDGAKSQDHLRAVFGRMGFNDQEIVALSGAHAIGRCHADRSGFDGPWTFSPITMTNDFYRLLLDEHWNERSWKGPRQFQDDSTKTLVMLPTDMALVQDQNFKSVVEKYAKDQDVFFEDFADVLVKLLELGVPFKDGQERMELERTE